MTSRSALVEELERLVNAETSLARHIETNEAEQRRKQHKKEQLEARIADAEFHLSMLRSNQVKVVHFQTFKDLRLALNRAKKALATVTADLRKRDSGLAMSRGSLVDVREERASTERTLAGYGKVIPLFPGR